MNRMMQTICGALRICEQSINPIIALSISHQRTKVQLSSKDVTGLPEDFLNIMDAESASSSEGWMHIQASTFDKLLVSSLLLLML